MFVCLLMLTLISPTPLQKLLARLTWMSLFWSASTWRGARLTTGLRRASASPPPPELARLAGPESWSWRSTTVEETGLRRRWCQGSVPRSSVSGRPRQDMTPQRGIVCVNVWLPANNVVVKDRLMMMAGNRYRPLLPLFLPFSQLHIMVVFKVSYYIHFLFHSTDHFTFGIGRLLLNASSRIHSCKLLPKQYLKTNGN